MLFEPHRSRTGDRRPKGRGNLRSQRLFSHHDDSLRETRRQKLRKTAYREVLNSSSSHDYSLCASRWTLLKMRSSSGAEMKMRAMSLTLHVDTATRWEYPPIRDDSTCNPTLARRQSSKSSGWGAKNAFTNTAQSRPSSTRGTLPREPEPEEDRRFSRRDLRSNINGMRTRTRAARSAVDCRSRMHYRSSMTPCRRRGMIPTIPEQKIAGSRLGRNSADALVVVAHTVLGEHPCCAPPP